MVADQRDRRPRTLCNLTYSKVNENTVPLAPTKSMQFGRALQRLLLQIHRADLRWGPVYMAKNDISDGFYNVFVNFNGAKNFGVILPTPPGQEPLVLFFLALPIGWVSSPPVFCALTETVTDLTNGLIQSNWKPPAHQLDKIVDTAPPTSRPPLRPGQPLRIRHRNRGLLRVADCYVDDFVLLAQGGRKRRRRLRQILFNWVDGSFRPPDDEDDIWKKDPNSLKKLLKGNGVLLTTKIVLGWLIDTVAGTIKLPPHRLKRLHDSTYRKGCPPLRQKDLQTSNGTVSSAILASKSSTSAAAGRQRARSRSSWGWSS